MNEYQALNKTPDFINKIGSSLLDAVGDDIKIDIKINELDTTNSSPSRVWDFINRNIGNQFSDGDYITHTTKRGSWEMKPIFEKSTGTLFTVMREERLIDLRKELPKRRTEHYAQALSGFFNKNLVPNRNQLSLFQNQNCFDEEQAEKIVHKILKDLSIPDNIVRNYAIILFSSKNYELVSLKCCLVKSDLSIVAEVDWSRYIDVVESSVVDLSVDSKPNYLNPANGLTFKPKAKNKIGQGINIELKKDVEKDIKSNE
jgi:hypothetical protein